VSGASVTVAVDVAVVVFEELTLSVIVTFVAYDPSSVYVWEPVTVNGPPAGPVMVPVEVWPSA
jgi:hypothetical protein